MENFNQDLLVTTGRIRKGGRGVSSHSVSCWSRLVYRGPRTIQIRTDYPDKAWMQQHGDEVEEFGWGQCRNGLKHSQDAVQ